MEVRLMPLDREEARVTSPGLQLNDFVETFCREQREAARKALQAHLQSQIEAFEVTFTGAKQKRTKRFQTPVGTIQLVRRVYLENGHYVCKADAHLGLPADGWFRQVEKLASALGVTVEFAHACTLLHEVTGIALSDHGLANRVETLGHLFKEQVETEPAQEVYPLDSALFQRVCRKGLNRPTVYVGADGIHVPLNRGQGTKEAKVGVVFWEADHVKVSAQRKEVRRREYVGTLGSRQDFADQLFKRFAAVVKQTPCQVVVLGDGAKWIWEMAEMHYPKALQILDFYHVSEYVWNVARELYPDEPKRQQKWVNGPLKRLKASRWQDVVESLRVLKGSQALAEAVKSLKRYLENNAERIDYKRYLALGLMIGSGVVESSNRRVVTQRLKQSGMHWSVQGAEGVIALRACYLSSSNQWCQFWNARAA